MVPESIFDWKANHLKAFSVLTTDPVQGIYLIHLSLLNQELCCKKNNNDTGVISLTLKFTITYFLLYLSICFLFTSSPNNWSHHCLVQVLL